MKNIYLGLDQSTSKTGYAISDKHLNLVSYGIIDLSKMPRKTDQDQANIRQKLKQELSNLIHNYKIKKVFLEDVFKLRNVDTLKKLCKILGSLEDICFELQMPYVVLQNKEWKSNFIIETLKRKSKDQKQQVKNRVLVLFPDIKAKHQDQYDAIGIVIAGIKMEQKEIR